MVFGFLLVFASWRSSAMANLRADIPDVYRLAYVLMIVTNMYGRQMDMNMTIWCFILLRDTVDFWTNRLIDAFSCHHFSDDTERRRVSNSHCLLNSLDWHQQNSSLPAFLWGQSTNELFSTNDYQCVRCFHDMTSSWHLTKIHYRGVINYQFIHDIVLIIYIQPNKCLWPLALLQPLYSRRWHTNVMTWSHYRTTSVRGLLFQSSTQVPPKPSPAGKKINVKKMLSRDLRSAVTNRWLSTRLQQLHC